MQSRTYKCGRPVTVTSCARLDLDPGSRTRISRKQQFHSKKNTILKLLQPHIVEASGPLQVCAGQESGCEAAIHAMRRAFNEDETEGASTSDAFNSLNRQTALHNIIVICPSLAQVLHNTYSLCDTRQWRGLFFGGYNARRSPCHGNVCTPTIQLPCCEASMVCR